MLTVIMFANLSLVLGACVHDNIRQEFREEELEELGGEVELCPIVSLFQNFQNVA